MELVRITALARRYHSEKATNHPGLPGLSLCRRTVVGDIEASVYDPVLCLILQGGKTVAFADQCRALQMGDVLLVSHDMPVLSRITHAEPKSPYLALILTLDVDVARDLFRLIAEHVIPATSIGSIRVGTADASLCAALVRYLELLDSPLDAKVLGPTILREVYYRLLCSPLGGALYELLAVNSRASRIARAVQILRNQFRQRLRVADLAQAAGMSPSSFHAHFKAVMGITPIQYQKDLRLTEARGLLVKTQTSITEVAFAVGYESPNHFTRDYSRKFGVPPTREANANGTITRMTRWPALCTLAD